MSKPTGPRVALIVALACVIASWAAVPSAAGQAGEWRAQGFTRGAHCRLMLVELRLEECVEVHRMPDG